MRRIARQAAVVPSPRTRRRLLSDGSRIVLEIFGPGPLAPRPGGPAEVAPVKAWLAHARTAQRTPRVPTLRARPRQSH